MPDDVADGELVRRIQSGGADGREAEAAFCRRFAPRVRLYGRRHLRDDELANDLVQSVLLAVLEAARAGRIAELDKVDRFVLGTCRNVALRVRDGSARTVPVSDEHLSSLVAGEIARHPETSLHRCFKQLDERAKAIVVMSFQEELRAEEIGSRLAMSAGNVRVARHRAVAALRECLESRQGGQA